ncbi:MAG: undecaprenyl-phosphate glucose phosphotransferase, partial [Nitrosospira sp.]
MAEANPVFSASTVSTHTKGPLGNNMLSAVETFLDPMALMLSLWLVSAGLEGELLPPYLILAVIVFSITFPGTSRLQYSIKRLVFDVLYSWFWVVLLLLLLGFATGYIAEFSSQALITWFWVAPLSQIGVHLALRASAPYLLMLQGPPQRAIIVGLNEQGAALASRIHETRYSKIELSGFFDDRSLSRLNQAANSQLLGRLRELPDFVKENRIQFIYLSLPMASQPRILHVLDELKDTTASIYFVPDMFITD